MVQARDKTGCLQDGPQQACRGRLACRARHADKLHLLHRSGQGGTQFLRRGKALRQSLQNSDLPRMDGHSVNPRFDVYRAKRTSGMSASRISPTMQPGQHARQNPARRPVTWLLRPGDEELDGLIRQGREQASQNGPRDMCRSKMPGVHPQAEHEQEALQRHTREKCASLRMKCMVMWDASAGHPQPGAAPAAPSRSTRPLAPSDTTPICMELEKMNDDAADERQA